MRITYSSVREPRWGDKTEKYIICIVQLDHLKGEREFFVSPDGVDAHAREIFQRCIDGDFGSIGKPKDSLIIDDQQDNNSSASLIISMPQNEFQEYISEVNAENSRGTLRGIILVQTSMIEKLLGEILEAFFIDHSDSRELIQKGALSEFSARANACFALGLIGRRELRACKSIKYIRNTAAHNWNLSGENSELKKDKCMKKFKVLYDDFHADIYRWPDGDLEVLVPVIYAQSCMMLFTDFMGRLVEIKNQRRQERQEKH